MSNAAIGRFIYLKKKNECLLKSQSATDTIDKRHLQIRFHEREKMCINTEILNVVGGGLVENNHYSDVIFNVMASQITSVSIVAGPFVQAQIKYNITAPCHCLAFVRGIHLVNSPHKGPVTRKMFPFDDVIMIKRITKPHSENALVLIWRQAIS